MAKNLGVVFTEADIGKRQSCEVGIAMKSLHQLKKHTKLHCTQYVNRQDMCRLMYAASTAEKPVVY